MYSLQIESSIHAINADEWDALVGDYPFAKHAFLSALENSGSVGHDSGWQAAPLLFKQGDQLLAVAPAYIKSHSWGEYVFDWAWADAYQRHGLDYYPKLILAIPFTPCTDKRIFSQRPLSNEEITLLSQGLQDLAVEQNLSGCHVLFQPDEDSEQWKPHWHQRLGVQYHWFNEDYTHFDDFLSRCASRKRKTLKKERKQVSEQGFTFQKREGNALCDKDWKLFHEFYQSTYAKRSGHGGYLTEAFFQEIGRTMADHIVMVTAEIDQHTVAAALNFKSNTRLYGRYWGCLAEFDKVHFETCYYQGIDYCIEHGLQTFDAGAQGEHKIQRGFTPIYTYSNHWLRHPEFHAAISDFVTTEASQLADLKQQLAQKLPFKIEH